jgi:hypothetical protein
MGHGSAAKRARLRQTEVWLVESGWWVSDCGWRHPRLFYPWPALHAVRLQKETDEGGQDVAHRMLRGEA